MPFLSRSFFSLISLSGSNFKAFMNSCWICITLFGDHFNARFSKLSANPLSGSDKISKKICFFLRPAPNFFKHFLKTFYSNTSDSLLKPLNRDSLTLLYYIASNRCRTLVAPFSTRTEVSVPPKSAAPL